MFLQLLRTLEDTEEFPAVETRSGEPRESGGLLAGQPQKLCGEVQLYYSTIRGQEVKGQGLSAPRPFMFISYSVYHVQYVAGRLCLKPLNITRASGCRTQGSVLPAAAARNAPLLPPVFPCTIQHQAERRD